MRLYINQDKNKFIYCQIIYNIYNYKFIKTIKTLCAAGVRKKKRTFKIPIFVKRFIKCYRCVFYLKLFFSRPGENSLGYENGSDGW